MVAIPAFLRDFLRLTFAMRLLERTRGRPGEEPKSAKINNLADQDWLRVAIAKGAAEQDVPPKVVPPDQTIIQLFFF